MPISEAHGFEADDDEIQHPGRARARDRERARKDAVARAWIELSEAGASPPADPASPESTWQRRLEHAVETILHWEWQEQQSTPDGVGQSLFTVTDRGFDADLLLHVLPGGMRRVRVEFDRGGGCVMRVAIPAESAGPRRRLDPRRRMTWAFSTSSPDAD